MPRVYRGTGCPTRKQVGRARREGKCAHPLDEDLADALVVAAPLNLIDHERGGHECDWVNEGRGFTRQPIGPSHVISCTPERSQATSYGEVVEYDVPDALYAALESKFADARNWDLPPDAGRGFLHEIPERYRVGGARPEAVRDAPSDDASWLTRLGRWLTGASRR